MKPVRFRYSDPGGIDEAVAFLAEHGDESKLLAGGQSLMPLLNLRLARPEYVVDLRRVPGLDHVELEGDRLRLGALVRQEDALASDVARQACPLLGQALAHVGHPPIRVRGTVGGSISHADPAAELPALAVALDAELHVRGPRGTREVPAREFFSTFLTTALEPDEILTEVLLPVEQNGSRTGVLELARRHGDFALAGLVGSVSSDGDRITSARLAAFGVDDVPRRMTDVEQLITGAEYGSGLLEEAADLARRSVEPRTDMHASGSYRRRLVGVLMKRLLEQTVGQSPTANGSGG